MLDAIAHAYSYMPITKPKLLVFYADKLHGELTTSEIRQLVHSEPEIYQGAYVFNPNVGDLFSGWFRCDGTPFPEESVPKPTRLLKLLLT